MHTYVCRLEIHIEERVCTYMEGGIYGRVVFFIFMKEYSTYGGVHRYTYVCRFV